MHVLISIVLLQGEVPQEKATARAKGEEVWREYCPERAAPWCQEPGEAGGDRNAAGAPPVHLASDPATHAFLSQPWVTPASNSVLAPAHQHSETGELISSVHRDAAPGTGTQLCSGSPGAGESPLWPPVTMCSWHTRLSGIPSLHKVFRIISDLQSSWR